ncbi:MAG: beta-galactosidase trimerization domain-containing protein [Pirellulaceae bacterium]
MQRLADMVLLILLASVTIVSTSEIARGQDGGYDTVVEPLPRPAWLDRIMMFCLPYQPAYEAGDTIKPMPWAQRLQEAGFVLAGMYPDGFCRLYEPAEGEDWPEKCRAEVTHMHALGMKVIAGVYPFVGERGPRDLLTAHPEWRLRSGNEIPAGPGRGCMVNPGFAEALRELLVRRVREYDIDGYQFDGWYQCTYCRCDGCVAAYKLETGRDIPPNDSLNVEYRKYVAWRDKQLMANLVQLRAAVKSIKPDFVLVNWNNNDMCGSAPSWMPEALNCVADWTNKEWWDASDVYSIWLNKRLRGASGDERPPGMQSYMFMRWGKDIESGVYHGSSTPMAEVMYRQHEILAMGGIPILWSGARAGWNDEDWNTFVNAFVEFVSLVQRTKALKYAVCIDSYTTLQNAQAATAGQTFSEGNAKALDHAVGYHRGGVARALLESHLPFDVISEHNVTRETLGQYRVVILPNNFCVSERIATLLREYVLQGGGLVATFETSLFDEWGKRHDDFALADLFGASYQQTDPLGPNRIGFSPSSHPVTEDPALRDLMGTTGATTYWGQFVRVQPDAGAVTPLVGTDVKNEANDGKKHWTPLLLSDKGQGRVAYFPAAIDAAYFDAAYPYQRMLIANAVRWAAKDDPPVTITAPMCVLAGFFTISDADKRQTIVHLLNGINTTTGHGSAAEKEFAIREEVVMVADVKVAFRGERPTGVFLVPGHTNLAAVKTERGWEATVPRMGVHAVVVAEY